MRAYFMKTERIGFSTWNDKDIEIATSLWSDPSVTKFISVNGKFDNIQIKEKLENEILNKKLYDVQYWPIFVLTTNENIGCCGLRPYNLDKGIYEIGCHLKPKFWGKGFASEAAKAVIDFAFQKPGAQNLFAGHNPNNATSKKFLTQLGFIYTHDEYYQPTGLQHPSYIYYK